MKNHNDSTVGFSWRGLDRTTTGDNILRDLAIALAAALAVMLLAMIGDANAQQPQRTIQVSSNNRTGMVTVAIGKSQDVCTDTSSVDVMVGDPEVAGRRSPLQTRPRQQCCSANPVALMSGRALKPAT